MKLSSIRPILISFLFCMPVIARSEKKGEPPVAVLVQLKVEKNRMDALAQAHASTMLNSLVRDRDGILHAMINDFKDNFNLCPVYYFMDTNYSEVEKGHLEGVLLNADLTPVANNPIGNNTNYLVVSYGKPSVKGKYTEKEEDPKAYIHDVVWDMEQAFIISDAHMHFKAMFYRYKGDKRALKKHSDKRYSYCSNDFEMEYFPGAGRLNKYPMVDIPLRMEVFVK